MMRQSMQLQCRPLGALALPLSLLLFSRQWQVLEVLLPHCSTEMILALDRHGCSAKDLAEAGKGVSLESSSRVRLSGGWRTSG